MADLPKLTCPSCGAALTESPRCPSCGLSLEGKGLFDPKHFHWLGVLFSGLTPIIMSAANWGRVGRTRERNLWLVLGFLGFVLLFTLLRALPPSMTFLGLGVSAGISYFLRDRQLPLFAAGLRLGANRSSAWKGVWIGVSVTIGALAVVILGYLGMYHIRSERAGNLLAEGRYAESAKVFAALVKDDPRDPVAVYGLATCHLFQGHWNDADRGFRQCLSMGGVDSAMIFANLAVLETAVGRRIAADSLAARARAMEPAVFTTLYNSEDVAMIADSLIQPSP